MQFKNIDYVNMIFEHTVLTKISGKPTYKKLLQIKRECAAKTFLVHSNLGGGANGLLGIVLTATEYALVSPVPFVRPQHPGPLVLPAGNSVTNLQREIARDTHNENLRVFTEVLLVEKALIKQISAAVPDIYLKQFRNVHSNAINTTVSNLLSQLMT